MEITDALVRQLERLAALRLSPESRALMRDDLARIVEYVRQIDALDTDAVEPTAHVVATPQQPLRDDRVQASLPLDAMHANAPDVHDGFYRVPRFLGTRDAGETSDA